MEPLEQPELKIPEPTEEDYARVQALFPYFTREQVEEATDNIDRYLEVVWQIYDEIRNDSAKYEKFKALIAEKKFDSR